MKKSLLLAAFAAAVLPMSAQNPLDEVNNLVANGNFEDTNYVQAVPGGYTWDPANTWYNLETLPGWNTNTGGEWNGTIWILSETSMLMMAISVPKKTCSIFISMDTMKTVGPPSMPVRLSRTSFRVVSTPLIF